MFYLVLVYIVHIDYVVQLQRWFHIIQFNI